MMAETFDRTDEQEERILKRHRRSVIIVMSEVIVLLLLAITAYGASVLNSYQYEELSPTVYRETSTERREQKDRRRTEEPETRISVVEETNVEGEVIGSKEVAIPVEPSLSGYRNILILGLDAIGNTDVMIIASVNNATGEVKLVSILRDTIMKMEDGCNTPYNKANHQYGWSGLNDTISMVNRNLGLDIGEYAVINWRGVAEVVDSIGGLEVTIPNEVILGLFNSYLAATNPQIRMWAPQLKTPGTYIMTGPQVVAFCRIRMGGYNDYGRTENQREVIQEFLERIKLLLRNGEFNAVINTARVGLSGIRTNLSPREILSTATQMQQYSIVATGQFPADDFTTATYLGNYAGKYGIKDPLVANDFADQVKKLHQFLFNDYSYEPSAAIQSFSYQMYLDRTGR